MVIEENNYEVDHRKEMVMDINIKLIKVQLFGSLRVQKPKIQFFQAL